GPRVPPRLRGVRRRPAQLREPGGSQPPRGRHGEPRAVRPRGFARVQGARGAARPREGRTHDTGGRAGARAQACLRPSAARGHGLRDSRHSALHRRPRGVREVPPLSRRPRGQDGGGRGRPPAARLTPKEGAMATERLISADSHVNPPKDLWTRDAPERLEDRVPRVESTPQGDFWVVDSEITGGIGLDAAAGRTPEQFKAVGLVDVDEAVAELERIATRGLRGFHCDPYPDERGGKPLWDPGYEPFWSAVAATGLPMSFHIVAPRKVDLRATFLSPVPGVKENLIALTPIGLCEVVSTLTFTGVLERHPTLRF